MEINLNCQFLERGLDIVHDISTFKKFNLDIPIYDDLSLDKHNTLMNCLSVQDFERVMYYGDNLPDFKINTYKNITHSNYESLVQYKIFKNDCSIVCYKSEIESWHDISCSCYGFLKIKKCSHVYHC